MKSGKDRCPGCDCRNLSGQIRASASQRSCCKKCGSPNSPCAYVAIMECFNEWPLKTNNLPAQGGNCAGGEGFYWPGFPYGEPGIWMQNKFANGLPVDDDFAPLMVSPFIFLGKKCVGNLNDDGCQYASYHAPKGAFSGLNDNENLHGGCNIAASYWRVIPGDPANSIGADWLAGFPWRNPFIFGPDDAYVPFRFERPISALENFFETFGDSESGRCTWPPYVTPEWVLTADDWLRSTAYCENQDNYTSIAWGPRETWTLDVDAGTYSFMANATDLWEKIGRGPPIYEFIGTTWSCEHRNEFRLINYREWPELKRYICIVAAEWPWYANPCRGDIDTACKCCEKGGAWNGYFDVIISGCQFSGPFSIPGQRYYDVDDVPYPLNLLPDLPANAPCGFQLGYTTYTTCPTPSGSGTGTGSGSDYWRGLAYLYYCDGNDYILKWWCQQVDSEGTHVDWVEAGVDYSTTCDCNGPRTQFTFTSLPCCCQAVPQCCVCENLPATGGVSTSIGESFTVTKQDCTSTGGNPVYVNAGPVFVCGASRTNVRVFCTAGIWSMTADGVPTWQGAVSWDGDCNGILLINTNQPGCTITVTI